MLKVTSYEMFDDAFTVELDDVTLRVSVDAEQRTMHVHERSAECVITEAQREAIIDACFDYFDANVN